MNQKRTSEISFNDHNAIYDAYDTKEDVENSVNLETDFNDNLKHKNTLYRSYGSLIRDGSLNLWFASERSNEKTIKKRERRNTPFLVPPAKISLSNLTPPIRRSSKIHSVCIVTTPPTPDVSAVLITVPTPPPRAYNRGPRAMETVRNDNSTSVTSATVNVSTARTLRNSFEVYGYDKKPTSSHVKQNKKLNYFRFAQSIFSTVTLIISIYLEALVYTSTSTKYFCKYLSASTIIFSSISVATNHFFALSYFKFKHLKNVLIAEVIGMTCQSCVKSIESQLNTLNGLISAKVHLIEENAEIKFDNNLLSQTLILETIENCGFEATLITNENSLTINNTMEITVGIQGMTCQSCVKSIESQLKTLEGLISAKVNLSQENADIKFDTAKLSQSLILETIENCGFETNLSFTMDEPKQNLTKINNNENFIKIILSVKGMTCKSCVSSVTKVLNDFGPLVRNVLVNLQNETAWLEFNTFSLTPTDLKSVIEDAGFECILPSNNLLISSSEVSNTFVNVTVTDISIIGMTCMVIY
ncbi:ATPase Cu transporting protein 7B [Clydaea vesicula]|uniref:ATPase Cu transporting protein 7B n=1 Tax=Clydaea vesicula TaxID=447962 RepID=A0AAD5TX43_9FUNG|nr:ATPase Cu transporting protein 7B [Clydaea vesicula]